MTPGEDVEAFLAVFERVAERERLPVAQWAEVLSPYLTGEPQKAYLDLCTEEALEYGALKGEILARLGVNTYVRAQRVNKWVYDEAKPARSQAYDLLHLVKKWLQPEALSSAQIVERVVVDRFVRTLPVSIQRWVGQGDPSTLDQVVCLVERHAATQDLIRDTGTLRTARRTGPPTPPARPTPPTAVPESATAPSEAPPSVPEARKAMYPKRHPVQGPSGPVRCWRCQRVGHMAAQCPLTTEPMDCGVGRRGSLYAGAVCTAGLVRPGSEPHLCQIQVNGRPVTSLLDSGSLVTLVRSTLVANLKVTGRTVGVICIHGDRKDYPTAVVTLTAPCGQVRQEVGIVHSLPYDVILGRDLPLFWTLWKGSPKPPQVTDGPEPEPDDPESGTPAVGVTMIGSEWEPDRAPLEVLAGEAETAEPITELESSPGLFGTAQLNDPTLVNARGRVTVIDGVAQVPGAQERYPHFALKQDLLYQVDEIRGEVVEQLLVPQPYRQRVLELAHKHLMSGHLGIKKTQERILQRFYWPGVFGEIKRFCETCPECQLTAPLAHFRSPLVPLPIIEVPFERIGMDLVGPLVKSARGHQHILVIVDYATRYPEAIPLRHTAAKLIARELFAVFCRVGLPKEILTDQGTPFMSKVTKELCRLLQIKQLRTSVYHPQTDGLVERFNKTLKTMLKRVISKDGKDWDMLLPYLMFAVREVPQASTGFSPFELLYARHPRGLLDLAKDTWEQEPTPHKSVIDHILGMQNRISAVMPIVKEHLQAAQAAQSGRYNRQATVRSFTPGDRVLVLIPTAESKFLAKWQGPYEIKEQVGAVNYRVLQPGRRKPEQVYHVNLLKPWKDRESLMVDLCPSPSSSGRSFPGSATSGGDDPEVKIGDTLTKQQRREARRLVQQNQDVFSELPGRTTLIQHDIVTEPHMRVRLKPYRVPEARRQAISVEVENMLRLGIIEKSKSEWASPIVLIPKPDGSLRFCNDFRRLNEISKFDLYPMPRVDELIDRLGQAQYFTTLDLTKGYWQVPLTESAKEKTAFVTPGGLFHYVVLPFGLHGAPATFQRLMDVVLEPHQAYASAYLDDIIIYSTEWQTHLGQVQAVVDALRAAGLTANPKKCALGLTEARYLGYVIGQGIIKPQINKVEAIQTWPRPLTTKQVRAFLGIVGYYRRFVPNFASISAPLTDLLKGKKSVMVRWTPQAEDAFRALKGVLCGQPVLVNPDFRKEFVVQTDASEVGLGAVLSQVVQGEEHPVTYLSRKLTPPEKNYSVVEKECLAIKWALESLRYYLLGRQFRLITDHSPLVWMRSARERNARVTRWFLSLQNFRFTVEHRAGRLQGNADALSRGPCLMAGVQVRALELRGGVCEAVAGVVMDGRYVSPRLCALHG